MRIFGDDGDYRPFESLSREATERSRFHLLAHGLMPNHRHLVPWSREDGVLAGLMQRLTTLMRRWRPHRHLVGEGRLYQEIYKSFPGRQDEHFPVVYRYVGRNTLRVDLV